MTDREFWQAMHRYYQGLADTIKAKYLGGRSDSEMATMILEMGQKAKAYVEAHPEVIRHGKYEE